MLVSSYFTTSPTFRDMPSDTPWKQRHGDICPIVLHSHSRHLLQREHGLSQHSLHFPLLSHTGPHIPTACQPPESTGVCGPWLTSHSAAKSLRSKIKIQVSKGGGNKNNCRAFLLKTSEVIENLTPSPIFPIPQYSDLAQWVLKNK